MYEGSQQPRLSVLMAVYAGDDAGYLNEALSSVIEYQSRQPDELIVVEDGPLSPALDRVLSEWQERVPALIRRVRLSENSGLGVALNKGLGECRYDFVARMDADDVCMSSRFERQMTFLEKNTDIDVLGAWAIEIDKFGNRGYTRRKPEDHDEIVGRIWTCPMIHPSVVFNRKFIQELGGYDARLRRSEDYDLWFRVAAANGKFANIPEPLLLYRFDHDSHKKQSVRFAWERSLVGYRGARMVKLPFWKRIGCFFPVFRALMPGPLQHFLYRTARGAFDRA